MRTRHLKKRIALSLMLFIGLGMFLIDLVLGLMSYRQVVKSEIVQAKATLVAIGHEITAPPLLSVETIRYLGDLSSITGLSIVMVGVEEELVFQSKMDRAVAEKLQTFTIQNVFGVNVEKQFSGGSFGLLGLQYEHLFLARSIRSAQGVSLGAVGVDVHLGSFAQSIWKGQRFVWIYILLNLVVLSGLAYWRFSQFLIVPLQQIATKAASYQDDDFYLTSDFQSDDVSTLSRSLDQMFRRIHTDRAELQKMVLALEEVNESLTKAQSDIIRAEKMASVGRLSAGIAHEIGNPLGIVLGYLELLKGDDISTNERLDFTSRAMSEIQRINKIIRELLDLARPSDENSTGCAVHTLLNGFKDDLALQSVIGDMQLSFDLTANCDAVEIDSEKLHQVFLNLLLNGADAVKETPDQGIMQITTATIGDDDPGPQQLVIRFIDNGLGIDPAHVKQIFDPFFTTKEVGYGTGLGLSVSYMIIENGGGTIRAKAADKGRGTEFKIVLPLMNDDL